MEVTQLPQGWRLLEADDGTLAIDNVDACFSARHCEGEALEHQHVVLPRDVADALWERLAQRP